jgi:hypothetical protein
VKAGDTLLTVAADPASVVLDALALKNANLDILYGDFNIFPGQQLRLPIHNCLADEASDCHAVSSGDTLQSIATAYDTTAKTLCSTNIHIFADVYCDPALRPLPKVHAGMELTVPRLHPTPPSPCKEIPGYWTCYTTKANDTFNSIAASLNTSVSDFTELNFGPSPQRCFDNCSNTTACPPSHKTPDCIQIGQVFVARVSKCTPKSGAWNCTKAPFGYGGLVNDLIYLGSPPQFFCKANRRELPACRSKEYPNLYWGDTETVKAPFVPCVPNDKSYCSMDESGACCNAYLMFNLGNPGVIMDAMTKWDDNSLLTAEEWNPYTFAGEFHVPRGSLPGCKEVPGPVPHDYIECIPTPGQHLCHRPLPPIRNTSCRTTSCNPWLWTDSVDQIAQQFGVSSEALCIANEMKNCSKLGWWCTALKIPIASSTSVSVPASAVV